MIENLTNITKLRKSRVIVGSQTQARSLLWSSVKTPPGSGLSNCSSKQRRDCWWLAVTQFVRIWLHSIVSLSQQQRPRWPEHSNIFSLSAFICHNWALIAAVAQKNECAEDQRLSQFTQQVPNKHLQHRYLFNNLDYFQHFLFYYREGQLFWFYALQFNTAMSSHCNHIKLMRWSV